MIAKNKCYLFPKMNQEIALISFTRNSSSKENKMERIIKKASTLNKMKSFPKRTKLSIYDQYLNNSFSKNTKLELLKIWLIDQDNLPKISNVKDYPISAIIGSNIENKNRIYLQIIKSFDFVPNLKEINCKFYHSQKIKQKIEKNILSKNMIFISNDDLKIKENFNSNEYKLIWRLIIDGNIIGCSFYGHYIDRGTQDFGIIGKALRKTNNVLKYLELS
ncbi:MAG: hypothetical protein GY830_05285 [Bacteroidetes bacterium]|nr:hypothetical protein [Bacteroidota bacterium]